MISKTKFKGLIIIKNKSFKDKRGYFKELFREKEINKKNILNCLISSSGNVLLGGEPVELKNIHRKVKDEIRKNDKLIVSVKAHEKAQYDVYVEVLDQLKMANATRISIAETE